MKMFNPRRPRPNFPPAPLFHLVLVGMRSVFLLKNPTAICIFVGPYILMQCSSIIGQDENTGGKTRQEQTKRVETIETRLSSIEARLTRIEAALFATVRFSEAEARKQLEAAKASLKNSETLFAKGLLSAFQMRIDRFNLERAQALHRMCIDHEDHRKIGATMEIFDAKRELEQKRFRLDNSEAMFERGFLAKSQMEIDRKAISVAEKKLAAAQAKLKAIGDPTKAPKPEPEKERPKEPSDK
ncbi:hypothetical protein N8639_01215 [bacterium]|nr:hypothetical protein [bacterium]